MKKVGILTYYSALNFGANLQACSTYCYLLKHGYNPIFINYIPRDAYNEELSCPKEQVSIQRAFQNQFSATEVCHDSKDVAAVLKSNDIHNVIIGSDAVAQHHPLLARIVFPSRHLLSLTHPSHDKMFPNPFWGEFLDYIDDEINVCLMSVSNQQSKYTRFTREEMRRMMKYLVRLKYISVRDNWTQDMYKRISNGLIVPEITPDPVFAFNYNVPFIPSRDELCAKFDLPEKYILLALRKGRTVNVEWVKLFERECKDKGYDCIGLPFPYGFNRVSVLNKKINLPLSPIDWYALIKYSSGFVGHNMHTIVSALHNAVPCFSLDQYGRRIFSQFEIKGSSKIFDILNAAGFSEYRSLSNTIIDKTPSPDRVFKLLMSFEVQKCQQFVLSYYEKYKRMMNTIEEKFC